MDNKTNSTRTNSMKVYLANDDNFSDYGNLFHHVHDEVVRLEKWPQHPQGYRSIHDGIGGGVTSGTFDMFWKNHHHYASNSGVADGDYCFASIIHDHGNMQRHNDEHGMNFTESDLPSLLNRILIWTEINYHACGSQYFYCEDAYMILVVAVIKDRLRWPDNITPDDFICFVVPPKVGAHINSFVWHCPPITISTQLTASDSIDPDSNKDILVKATCLTAQAKVHSKVYYNIVSEDNCVLAANIDEILSHVN